MLQAALVDYDKRDALLLDAAGMKKDDANAAKTLEQAWRMFPTRDDIGLQARKRWRASTRNEALESRDILLIHGRNPFVGDKYIVLVRTGQASIDSQATRQIRDKLNITKPK